MGYNKQKIKGTAFEKLIADLLNKHVKNSNWRRVPSSGALGTTLSEPLLMGDVTGKIDSFPKKFKIEAKVGYNSSKNKGVKQFTLKKEWLDKIREEAETDYSFPVLFGKFSGAMSGTKIFAVIDINEFVEILNYITELKKELEKFNEAQEINKYEN